MRSGACTRSRTYEGGWTPDRAALDGIQFGALGVVRLGGERGAADLVPCVVDLDLVVADRLRCIFHLEAVVERRAAFRRNLLQADLQAFAVRICMMHTHTVSDE